MKCKSSSNDGTACRAFAQTGKEYCFRHDPVQHEQALRSSQKGGKNRTLKGIYGKSVTIESPDDIRKFLGVVINSIWANGVPVQIGSSMGFLARCWLEAYEAENTNKRLDDIEQRLESFTLV